MKYMLQNLYLSGATRTRAYAGIPERLEIGGGIANALTSVSKDSYVIEIKRFFPDAEGKHVR